MKDCLYRVPLCLILQNSSQKFLNLSLINLNQLPTWHLT